MRRNLKDWVLIPEAQLRFVLNVTESHLWADVKRKLTIKQQQERLIQAWDSFRSGKDTNGILEVLYKLPD